jgi:CubicO group peptidase (beta-lactamase class C family)
MRAAPITLLTTLLLLSASSLVAAQTEPARAELTWNTLESRISSAAEAGFSGCILVVHDGQTILNKGFGFANRAKQIPNTPDTIFGIGSTPIDFTKAGILLLAQRGRLDPDDPITKYFDQVPEDKRAITIDHLMTGRSGLQNFHDLPADANPDHTWIDRDEAMRRILDHKLLFEPGQGREHSHSAWGVLAAIIESVSEQSYQNFVQTELFEPAGMQSTGFFGTMYPPERVAIGYGDRTSGEINAPPYWGRTSWLVMGSGGMVSTVNDLYRWNQAIRNGRILEPEWAARYWSPPGAVLEGGDMFGFQVMYTEGPDTLFFMATNAATLRGGPATRLGETLAELVLAETRPKYTLGVMMDVRNDETVVIEEVVPDSAAAQAGLRAGDVLVALNNQTFQGDPYVATLPYLRKGSEMTFRVLRDGEQLVIKVTPRRRE